MRYYRKMFFAFASVALVFTLLLEAIFVSLYWIPSRKQFSMNLEQTARQASEYTDLRLRSLQETGVMMNLSDYTRAYLIGSLNGYERLRFARFVSLLSGTAPTLKQGTAVTRYDDDYVIMNNSTGNLDFFRASFHIPEELLTRAIEQFNENKSDTLQILNVQDDAGEHLYVLAFCQWVGLPQPLYIFNSYTTQQLFHMNALSEGTLAVYYNNRLAAAAGKLNVEQLTTRLQNGTNYAGLDIRHASSSVPGFRYVYLAEPQRIFTPALLWMFAVGLAALAASLGIMGLITARMYQPIRGVLMTTGQFTAGDEMAHIRDTIVNLHTDVEEMAQALAQHKAAQESSVLHDLLTGVIPPEQAGEALAPFPELPAEGPLALVLLRYTPTAPFTGGFHHGVTSEARQRLAEALQQHFAACTFFRVVEMSFETQVLLLQVDWTESMTEGLKNTIIGVEPEYGLDISAFIPPPCEELKNLPTAYRKGMKMVEAREYTGSNIKVVHWEEARTPMKSTVYFPLQVEQNLINSVIHGKTGAWQSAVNEIIETNRVERNAGVSSVALMFEGTLNRLLDGSGAAGLELTHEQLPAVELSFRSCRTYEELKQQAQHLFDVLAFRFASEQEKSNSGLADKMLAYVHEHYMREITLFDLADYLNLSRNYVSTLFKSATGCNFKDYISEYRYGKARQMIQENPDMRIKEVAELVGCNTDALSRLFMRYSGILPKEYREQASQGLIGSGE
ncbi:helix-turn-helix transcriptional regulator [Paenibacillus sp. FSL H8-0034]|uniref:helix-turn-helix transcriptional regulator n=1 Tax=Paenibacillus sp. FSL H8-0034 TaxID=2954671 RepID=UPI0030F7498A